jgi:subtilisin family serine protease
MDMTTGQPQYFYYLGQQRVPLELVDDTLIVAFKQPISERRLAELRAGAQPLDAIGQHPSLLDNYTLVYHPGAAPGREKLRVLAERLSRAPSVKHVTFAFLNPETGLYLVLTDEISVRFKPDASDAQIAALNAAERIEVIEQRLFARNQYRMRVLDPTPHRALDVANALYTHPLVEWAEPNFIMQARLLLGGSGIPADLKDRQWHLRNTGQNGGITDEDVRATGAWSSTRGSTNVVVAIIDSGVDMGHPDLQANLLADRGRNFAGGPAGDPSPDADPSPFTAHGTSCAGVTAGIGGKISGIAPQCKILPIKNGRIQTTPTQVITTIDPNQCAQALEYAAQFAQVLSNSWTTNPSNQLDQAIQSVTTTGRSGKGTVVLFASGNDNRLMPTGAQGRHPNVITVGASTNVGTRAGYSNFGDANDTASAGTPQKRLSVVAPSSGDGTSDGGTERIYTTDIRGPAGWSPGPPTAPDPAIDPDYTGNFGGTSSATPLAAGVCALMLSINENLTRAQVKYILEATADKIATGQHHTDVPDTSPPAAQLAHYTQAAGHDPRYGYGRVNAEQAVRAAQGQPVRQLVGSAYQQAVPMRLRRVPGTNEFVSDELQLIDARRDPHTHGVTGATVLRGAPGGFIRASFQPTGGGPAMVDELTVRGEP